MRSNENKNNTTTETSEYFQPSTIDFCEKKKQFKL